jgi:hypothetical protein
MTGNLEYGWECRKGAAPRAQVRISLHRSQASPP